jgi:phosphoserine phosphatase RsbU/P
LSGNIVRKVLLPIHIKLVSFFMTIMIAALTFYVMYASHLFNQDKLAYVYETVKLQNDAQAKIISKSFEEINAQLDLFSTMAFMPQFRRALLNKQTDLIGLITVKKSKLQLSDWNFKLAKHLNLNLDSTKNDLLSSPFSSMRGMKIHSGLPLVSFFQQVQDEVFIMVFEQTVLKQNLKQSPLFANYLLHTTTKRDLLGHKDFAFDFFERTELQNFQSGTIIHPILEQNAIVAFYRLSDELILLTAIDELKALAVSTELKEKSLFFGLFVFALTIIAVTLFARLFTGPIEKLFQATQMFASNHFDHRIELANRDELGVLADSFNQMSHSIEIYMQEMVEKNRLHNEMLTAKIVQDSFFQPSQLENAHFHLAGFYRPATECGGDWWGYIQHDDKLMVLILDATGHGTPAALVTAMAYNCFSIIKKNIAVDSEWMNNPAAVMQLLNHSLCSIHSKMQATAFVAIVDYKQKLLTYSNASHISPLVLSRKDGGYSKESTTGLVEAIGKRLGEDEKEIYHSKQHFLNAGDMIVIYTDGLIEGVNPAGKAFGKRLFLKSILSHANQGANLLIDKTSQEAMAYFETDKLIDDITLLALEIK